MATAFYVSVDAGEELDESRLDSYPQSVRPLALLALPPQKIYKISRDQDSSQVIEAFDIAGQFPPGAYDHMTQLYQDTVRLFERDRPEVDIDAVSALVDSYVNLDTQYLTVLSHAKDQYHICSANRSIIMSLYSTPMAHDTMGRAFGTKFSAILGGFLSPLGHVWGYAIGTTGMTTRPAYYDFVTKCMELGVLPVSSLSSTSDFYIYVPSRTGLHA